MVIVLVSVNQVFMCSSMCVCVCVRIREIDEEIVRERGRERVYKTLDN